MRYLKTFESFAGHEEDCAQVAAEILSMAGEDVTAQEVEQSVKVALAEGEAQTEEGDPEEGEYTNESVMEFLNWWWDLLTQTQQTYGGEGWHKELTGPAVAAWLATLAVAGTVGGAITYSIYKVGKAIKGMFGSKEVDFTEFVEKWCKKNGVELAKIDVNSEEGKKIMARMLADFKASGGKI